MKKVLYFEPRDPCCDNNNLRSQEKLLKDKAVVGIVYLVDRITGKEWGDDWDVVTKCYSAGAPYPDKCEGLEIKEIRLGESLQ